MRTHAYVRTYACITHVHVRVLHVRTHYIACTCTYMLRTHTYARTRTYLDYTVTQLHSYAVTDYADAVTQLLITLRSSHSYAVLSYAVTQLQLPDCGAAVTQLRSCTDCTYAYACTRCLECADAWSTQLRSCGYAVHGYAVARCTVNAVNAVASSPVL
jgi:hypothetical protein